MQAGSTDYPAAEHADVAVLCFGQNGFEVTKVATPVSVKVASLAEPALIIFPDSVVVSTMGRDP